MTARAALQREALSEVSEAVMNVVRTHGPSTLRELTEKAQIGQATGRYTVPNLLRGGHLLKVGHVRRAYSKRWCALYDVPESEFEVTRVPGEPGTGLDPAE